MLLIKSLYPLLKKHVMLYLCGFLFLAIASGLQIIIPLIIGKIIDSFYFIKGDKENILTHVLLLLLISLLVVGARFGWRACIQGAARRVETKLRSNIFNKLLATEYSEYKKLNNGQLITIFNSDVYTIRQAISMAFVSAFDSLFIILTVFIVVFLSLGINALTCFLFLFAIAVFLYLINRKIEKRYSETQTVYDEINSQTLEIFKEIKAIKSNSINSYILNRFSSVSEKYKNCTKKISLINGLINPIIILISGITSVLLIITIGSEVLKGNMTLGNLVAMFGYLQLLVWPMSGIGSTVNSFLKGNASIARINNLLSSPCETDGLIPFEKATNALNPDLVIHNLAFSFSSNEKPILKDINMKIPFGARIGITGPTSSGKTILSNILMKNITEYSGKILLNGINIKDISFENYRKYVSLVSQDSFLFSGTIKENVAFKKDEIDFEKLCQATAASILLPEILKFPNAWQTEIGERAAKLSGGQRQRLSLARMFYYNPDVIILDDALSGLDATTECHILENLNKLYGQKTVIIISNKLKTIENCDLIYVIVDGTILQVGNHEQLTNISGYYKNIWNLQNNGYLIN